MKMNVNDISLPALADFSQPRQRAEIGASTVDDFARYVTLDRGCCAILFLMTAIRRGNSEQLLAVAFRPVNFYRQTGGNPRLIHLR
jgi:hypothetical protein